MANSSTRKAAKLAQQGGGGQRFQFQGGTLFPIVVALTIIIGVGLIVYARETVPPPDESEPTIDAHWHAAYGFNLCGTWYQLEGALEETNSQGRFTNAAFLRSGVHSHDDGLIHWHPYTSAAVGRNADLGVFLDTYEVEVTDEKITFPEENALGGMTEWIEGETQCDGEDAQISVVAWDNFADTDDGTTYLSNIHDIRFDQDGMAFGIYFGPPESDREKPPWSPQLPTLATNDDGQVRPEDLLGGGTSIVTLPEATTPGATTPDAGTNESGTSEPNTSDAPDTSEAPEGSPTTSVAEAG